MRRLITFFSLLLTTLNIFAQDILPTPSQVAWQDQETTAFIHFGPNTFNDVEWGYGDSDPALFNPVDLDCEQWVTTLKNGGMKCVILTAKHHDGFCLWPSKYTDYTIASSPYKNGKGDIVRELSDACRRHGLKFGVYLSPWDRHQAFYGTEEYIQYYRNQIRELLTQYGEIAEVWLDGANGGDGYYGGACEKRSIDGKNYYRFSELHELIYSLQPNTIIFSDAGPGCRWVGNEKGIAGETNWSFLREKEVYPGYPNYKELTFGHIDGTKWIPAECDVSIRPGWFYHSAEDSQVKTPKQLADLYMKSVGRNGLLLLNVPPMKNGLISPIDSLSLAQFNKWKNTAFSNNLLATANIKVSNGENDNPIIEYKFKKPAEFNTLVLAEDISKGQHCARFELTYQLKSGTWLPVPVTEQTTTIGHKRILQFSPITAKRLRLRITDSMGKVSIKTFEAYNISE